MLSRQLAVLVAKDLRLHWRALAGAMAGTLTLAAAAAYAIPQGSGPRVALVFNLNLMLALLWSEWLITRERSKGTFRWLRTLPVDDRAVVGSKFAAAGITGATHRIHGAGLLHADPCLSAPGGHCVAVAA